MLEINRLYNMNCIEGIKLLDDNSIDSIVTDPPYELGFMGKSWDSTGIAYNIEMWQECLRVLKPGGYLLSFSGSRTYHRMACAIEDAGFEIRDQIMWIYGSGFPKSMDISKAIDKKFGAKREVVGKREHPTLKDKSRVDRQESSQYHASNPIKDEWEITAPSTEEAKQWFGWGTSLKPAHEPIVVARKPLSEKTVADNVLKWSTGGINIDGCRIKTTDNLNGGAYSGGQRCEGDWKEKSGFKNDKLTGKYNQPQGRFPANIIFDEEAGKMLDRQSGISVSKSGGKSTGRNFGQEYDNLFSKNRERTGHDDSGGASRFFYCAKASKSERGEGNTHPTVKPISLIKYLITLVTPPNGICLDPFEGSGTHIMVCKELNFNYIGFELNTTYCGIIENRTQHIV